MEVHYTQNKEISTEYSIRIGAFDISKARNPQHFTEQEGVIIKTSPLPCDVIQTDWIDREASAGKLLFNAIKNNKDMISRLLPHNHTNEVSDYEILVLFQHSMHDMLKACVRDKKTNQLWLLTSWNQEPLQKHIKCVQDGWYTYRSHMIAPAAFYAKLKEVL